MENNWNPCKFTELEMKEVIDDRNDIMKVIDAITTEVSEGSFENSWNKFSDMKFEGKRTISESNCAHPPIYEVVAGQENKEISLLIKEFTTDPKKCIGAPKHTQKITFGYNGSEPLDFDVKNGLVKVEINYPYITKVMENIADTKCLVPIVDFVPLDCFFPTWRAKDGFIRIVSCRRTVEIPIKVYPDIQWYLTAYIKLSKGVDKDSAKRLGDICEGMKFDQSTMRSSFKVGLVVCWDNSDPNKASNPIKAGKVNEKSTQNYSAFFIKPFEMKDAKMAGNGSYADALKNFTKNKFYSALLDTIRALQDVVSLVEMMNQAVALARSAEADYPLKERKLLQVEILTPDLDLSLGWRAGAKNGKVGLVIEGRGRGTIIGMKGKLDLFCLLGRTTVIALELVEWASSIEFVFNLEFAGEWGWEGELGYHEARNEWKNRFATTGKISVTLNINATVKPGTDYTAVTENQNEYGIMTTMRSEGTS